jgi:hypothetical protein
MTTQPSHLADMPVEQAIVDAQQANSLGTGLGDRYGAVRGDSGRVKNYRTEVTKAA